LPINASQYAGDFAAESNYKFRLGKFEFFREPFKSLLGEFFEEAPGLGRWPIAVETPIFIDVAFLEQENANNISYPTLFTTKP
jgi:hypothetical protein